MIAYGLAGSKVEEAGLVALHEVWDKKMSASSLLYGCYIISLLIAGGAFWATSRMRFSYRVSIATIIFILLYVVVSYTVAIVAGDPPP